MTSPGSEDPLRILIVDDSVVIRGFISRALADVPNSAVVGSVGNGQLALDFLKREPADIVILDIEMPVMTGIEALPGIIRLAPDARVLMSSTLTHQGAEITLKALALGAADYVTKPTSTREQDATMEWKHDIAEKVRDLGLAAWQARHNRKEGSSGAPPAPPMAPAVKTAPATPRRLYEGAEIKLRPVSGVLPDVIAVGSSTGGPQALFHVLPHLKNLRQPIVITQHMPKTFTTILAQHITRETGLPATEAKDGDVLKGGQAYVAPGDYHMLFEKGGTGIRVKLDQGPQENFCRPAVDPMLRSLAEMYGANKVLTVILTGMGSDGAKGCEALVSGGGTVVGQDQPSSVVWGMPGAVATRGLCSAILPLDQIGPYLRKLAGA